MKYALLSDIHANLPALESALEDIGSRGVDGVYHLGDLVGYAPWPNEVVRRLATAGIQGVAGNYDSTVALDYPHCGCKYEDERQEELSHLSYEWTRANVTPVTREHLRSLPFRLDLRPGGGHLSGPSVILVHAAPTLNTLYWTEDRTEDFCRKMIHTASARAGDVLCFGHTHVPWQRRVDGVTLVNAGSVGRPKDGDWRPCYVLVEVEGTSTTVKFARVEYDLERAMAAIARSGLPTEFAEHLATGGRSRAAVAER